MTGMTQRDKWIPWYFVLFFTIIAAVNAVMVTMAIRTHTGTITDHPYEKGIAYNQVVKAESKQEELGWKANINLNNNILQVSFKDAHDAVLHADKITARMIRPTQEGMDFEVALENGQTSVDFPVKGLWEIRIFASIEGQSYQQSKRVVVQ